MAVPFLCAKHCARDGRRNQVFGGFGSPTSARVSWSSTQGMGDDAGQARSRSVLTGLDNHMITGAVPALLPAPDQDMTARHGSLLRIRTDRFHTKPLVPPEPADQWLGRTRAKLRTLAGSADCRSTVARGSFQMPSRQQLQEDHPRPIKLEKDQPGFRSSYEACGSSVLGSALPVDPSKVQSCLRENSRNSSESNSIALPLA